MRLEKTHPRDVRGSAASVISAMLLKMIVNFFGIRILILKLSERKTGRRGSQFRFPKNPSLADFDRSADKLRM